MRSSLPAALLTTLVLALPVQAQSPNDLLKTYETAAKASAGFAGFSAMRGSAFFKSTHGSEWSCASCHDNPMNAGRHAKTGKAITPLAPSANASRFTTIDKTEKWFRRNCNDVLSRDCSAQEKGDVLAYLLSLAR